MNNNKLYLTTGEFAKLCHTTKNTLFHYCDIGLFSPAYTDENGYRYYSVLQYDLFLTITQLRTTGMSLSEIKSYITKRTPQNMVELYNKQEEMLKKQISKLKQIKERISSQKNNIMQVLSNSEEYFLEKRGKSFLLCSDVVLKPDDYTMTKAIGDLIYLSREKTTSNTLGMVCNAIDAVNLDNYPFQFFLYTSSQKQKNCQTKLAGTYLSTYHKGEYETLGNCYKKLISYANSNNIELDDWIYAETIIGDWAVCKPQDYIIKVSIKTKESGEK